VSALPASSSPGGLQDDRVDVSVLVPVLNEERRIRETVAAMQAQRFDGAIELLFADGGSDDRTREILLELAAHDPRIRLLDNPRRHTASGLNVCLREARGEFVARMDALT
jgi:glycosyltransferase involved in cell wall biosynthesis